MGSTDIEWATKVWNPDTGCTPVSAGCANCYARRMAQRLKGRYGYPADDPFRVTLHEDRLAAPLSWRKPQRVFVNSMGDLFHKEVPNEYISAVLGVIAACPQHTFIVLTKRSARMVEWFQWVSANRQGSVAHQAVRGCTLAAAQILREQFAPHVGPGARGEIAWPLPNLWLGVSVEDQKSADERISELVKTTAAKLVVSYEPALGPVDFSAFFGGPYIGLPGDRVHENYNFGIGWVIVGGETGPKARPFDVSWARSVVNQCQEAGVPIFVKQLGSWPYDSEWHGDGTPEGSRMELVDKRGKDPGEWAAHLRVQEVPG